MQVNPPLYVTKIVEATEQTNVMNVERLFHSRQISATRLNLWQQRSSAKLMSRVFA